MLKSASQLVCEGQPTKATRMMQAEEAVSRIKVIIPKSSYLGFHELICGVFFWSLCMGSLRKSRAFFAKQSCLFSFSGFLLLQRWLKQILSLCNDKRPSSELPLFWFQPNFPHKIWLEPGRLHQCSLIYHFNPPPPKPNWTKIKTNPKPNQNQNQTKLLPKKSWGVESTNANSLAKFSPLEIRIAQMINDYVLIKL